MWNRVVCRQVARRERQQRTLDDQDVCALAVLEQLEALCTMISSRC